MKVETIFYNELSKLGFKKKGKRTFYLVKDDIIGMIVLERPSVALIFTILQKSMHSPYQRPVQS